MGWLIHGRSTRGSFRADNTAGAHTWSSSAERARVDEASLPTGHDDVDRVLREHFVRG